MNKTWFSAALLAGILSFQAYALPQEQPVLERPDLQAFLDEMVEKYQFDKEQLTSWFNTTKIKPDIIAAMTRPYEALPWHKYRSLFVTDSHIDKGVEFWKKNEATLKRAQQTYGVPPEIIVAIIGVETRYGTYKGKHAILDALSTLAFEYPKRAKFFKKELEQFLLLVKEQGLDPTEMLGSYAGAMGVPQFISSSYREYAVDFSGNGKSDLINNIDDAIGSVANYFARHGWKANEPVAVQAQVKSKDLSNIEQSTNSPKPLYSLAELKQKGVEPKVPLRTDDKFAMLSFEDKKGQDYWLGYNNFYVITRYNHSHHYAMAVYQLSQGLKSAFDKS